MNVRQSVPEVPSHLRDLYDLGFSLIPLLPWKKVPMVKWERYKSERASLETIAIWASETTNFGIVTGRISGVVVLDLDTEAAIAEAKRHGLPEGTLSVRTPNGLHVYLKHPGGTIRNRVGLLLGADFRGDGGFVVAPGSSFSPSENEKRAGKSGGTYSWITSPLVYDLEACPQWLLDLLCPPASVVPVAPKSVSVGSRYAERALDLELVELLNAPEGERNNRLNISAMKMGQFVGGGLLEEADVRQRLQYAAQAIGLEPDEIGPTVASGMKKGKSEPRALPAKGVVLDGDISEDAIASEFTRRYGNALRFDHSRGTWMEWDGSRYREDGRAKAFHYARVIGRTLSNGQRSLCKAAVAGGAERFARADPVHATDATVWDLNPMLLGTPLGTVDLRTGEVCEPNPDDMMTKQTSVAPETGEPVLWLRFLEEALRGDAAVIRFLRQWAGYCLTGSTVEQQLAFLIGSGGNGKGVFTNTLVEILGDYAVTAAMETFTASRNDRHSTELAMLRGARLVTASETEAGRGWAEAKIKALTGSDPITARFMRQDNFTFTPQFKLLMSGNHAPTLHNVDEAMRRRFNIVPFIHKPANADPDLLAKLRSEHGRILQWAIEGCLDWQANKLLRPEAVQIATGVYFEDQDVFGRWLEERCTISPGGWGQPTELFQDWVSFAHSLGSEAGNTNSFSAQLVSRGFEKSKRNSVRGYRGISLKVEFD